MLLFCYDESAIVLLMSWSMLPCTRPEIVTLTSWQLLLIAERIIQHSLNTPDDREFIIILNCQQQLFIIICIFFNVKLNIMRPSNSVKNIFNNRVQNVVITVCS